MYNTVANTAPPEIFSIHHPASKPIKNKPIKGTIHSSKVVIDGTHTDVLKYQNAKDIQVQVSAGFKLVHHKAYTSACEITIEGNGLVAASVNYYNPRRRTGQLISGTVGRVNFDRVADAEASDKYPPARIA